MGISSRPVQGSPRSAKFNKKPRVSQKSHRFWGWTILVCTWTFFLVTTFTLYISKLMAKTEVSEHDPALYQQSIKLLNWIIDDFHYCFLIPLSFPVAFFFVFLNWLGMKYFRHN